MRHCTEWLSLHLYQGIDNPIIITNIYSIGYDVKSNKKKKKKKRKKKEKRKKENENCQYHDLTSYKLA